MPRYAITAKRQARGADAALASLRKRTDIKIVSTLKEGVIVEAGAAEASVIAQSFGHDLRVELARA